MLGINFSPRPRREAIRASGVLFALQAVALCVYCCSCCATNPLLQPQGVCGIDRAPSQRCAHAKKQLDFKLDRISFSPPRWRRCVRRKTVREMRLPTI